MSAAPRPTAEITDRPPGHARILGAPRSGKTTLLVERFQYLSRAGHRPLVIAFGREQRDRLLERLIPPGTARFGAMPVTTHGMLATRLISGARPGSARILRDVDERVVLDRVLAANPGLLRSDLRSIVDSRSFRDTMLDVLHRLVQNGVTVAQGESAAKVAADPRARDALRLFACYRQHLDARDLITFYDAAWVAARVLEAEPSLAASHGACDVILVDDFQDLDAGQFQLLQTIAPPKGALSLEVFGDPTGSRFSFRGTSDRFLRDEFPRAYRPSEFTLASARASDPRLAASIEALGGVTGRGLPAQTDVPKGQLPLFDARPVGDVDTGVAWNASVRAVRAADEIAELHHAAGCVAQWLEAGIRPGDIAVIARDPERIASLVHHVFRERGVPVDAGIHGDTAADAFVHALVGALGRDADGRFAEALEASPLLASFCHASDGSPRDVARLVSSLRVAHGSRDGVDLAGLLDARLQRWSAGARVSTVVGEDWRRYVDLVARAGGVASLDEFRRAYLDAGTYDTPRAEGPHLVSARAISGHTFRAAVVVACAEGVFPRLSFDDSYLSPAALAAALDGIHAGAAHDFTARADREAREREETGLVLSALSAASDALVVSYSAKADGEHREPAAALAPLFMDAADAGRTASPAMQSALAIATCSASTALASRIVALDPISSRWLAPGPAPTRPRLNGFVLSPSSLDTFSRCARKFFYAKVLRIPEPGSIYLDVGNVLHGTLKRIIEPGTDGDTVRAQLESGDFSVAVDEVLHEEMPDAPPWLQDLTRVHIALMLRRVATLEAGRSQPYTVRTVEQNLDLTVDGEIVLRGRVDRIDDVEGLGPVVVDYKTGDIKKTAATIIRQIEDDRKHWQVPLYSELAASTGPRPVAFLFYVVQPAGETHVVGVQTAEGRLPAPIPDGGKSRSPYGRMAAATLERAVGEALALRSELVKGEREFERTETRSECERCHFIHVCRRSHA